MSLNANETLIYRQLRDIFEDGVEHDEEDHLRVILERDYSNDNVDICKVISQQETPPEEPSHPSSPNTDRIRLMGQVNPDEFCPTLLHLSLLYNGFDFWGTKALLEIAGKDIVGIADRRGFRALDIILIHDDQYWPTLALVVRWTPIEEMFRPHTDHGYTNLKSDDDTDSCSEYNLVDVIVNNMSQFHGTNCDGKGYGEVQAVIQTEWPLFVLYARYGYNIDTIYECMHDTVDIVLEMIT